MSDIGRMRKRGETRVLRVTLAVLAIAGSWQPASWTSLFKHVLYNVYTMLIVLTLYTFSMTQILELVLNANDIDTFGDALFNALISLLACYKTITIRMNHESIVAMINQLAEAPFKPLDPCESVIRQKFDKRIANNTSRFFILVIISCCYIVMLSLFTQFKNGVLMYKAWLPFDYSVSAMFYLAYTNQLLSFVFIGLIHPTSDSLICGLLLHVCCQLEILEYRLSNLPYGRGNLRDCVRHHMHIYEFAYTLNEKFSKIVPSEFMMVTVVMCYELIRLAVASSNAAYIQDIISVACALAAIFYYCWFGNEIKLKSLQLSDNLYNIEWTLLSDSVKKGLLMIMNRATIPIEFKSSHILSMNLDSFVSVIKTSYQVFNVLIRSRRQQA